MSGTGTPRVDAVVNALGAGDHVPRTLQSLARARGIASAPGDEVVVLYAGEAEAGAQASGAGARVVWIRGDEPHTPGAARNAGARAAPADYLLFVDGDIEVEAGFLRRALSHLEGEAQCAGFGGRLDERQWRDGQQVGAARDLYCVGDGGPVAVLGALWLCRRQAFEAVGGFDPELPSEEDFELSLRLRLAGYTLYAEAAVAGQHDCGPRPSWRELGRRWRSGLFAGQGLALRKYWGRAGFAELLSRQRLFVAALVGWAAGLVALGAALAGRPEPFVSWVGLSALAALVMTVRKRSVRLALFSLVTWSVQGVALLRSLTFGPWGEMRAARGGRP